MTLLPSDQDIINQDLAELKQLEDNFQKRNGKSIVEAFAEGLARGLATGWHLPEDPDEARDYMERN